MMKIEISIEKGGEEKKDIEHPEMPMEEGEDEMELTPEQIAQMAKKLKSSASLSRAERTMLAQYLMSEAED